ncbi:MAG: tetratricopeptide repeat protein [Planctomycetaceae bacterium]|nr:tetratricopeptide repeat protein [Planctomycetaceae bacterium]
MKTLNVTMFILLTFCGVISAAAEVKSAAVLLQEGIYAEETEGNLDKAMGIYTQIRSDYNDVERIAARATYQLGACYLKKGDKEQAAKYFEEVVEYFPQQKAIVEKAQQQLDKLGIKKTGELDSISSELVKYLFDLQRDTYAQAKKLGIKSNTIVHIVDESFVRIQAGLVTIENDSDKQMEGDITLGNSGSNAQLELYDENLQQQKFRIEDNPQKSPKYTFIWTADKPLLPGETKTLGYRAVMPEPLPKSAKGYEMTMANMFGDKVIENFVAVIPTSLEITNNGTKNITSHRRIGNFDVYVWQKNVPLNTMHEENIVLGTRSVYSESAKPTVVDSFPKAYSNDIDPATKEISVTFDEDMFQHGWSWCRTGPLSDYPTVLGNPKWRDNRTCVLPVKVEPARSYLVIINYAPYESFKNTDMIPAKTYAIVFATKDNAGNSTQIRADLLQKAQEINANSTNPEPILNTVPAKVREYIVGEFYKTFEKATEKGLRTNSHVHIIDKDLNRSFGNVEIFYNSTSEAMDGEIAMGSNDSSDIYIYDEKGVKQKIRTFKIPASNYRYFWTPSEPIEPNEKRMLFYSYPFNSKLTADANQQCALTMQNHYGSPVIEDFYVVVPANFEITSQTEPYTSRGTAESFDIYCWSKEQGTDVVHKVQITLAKKN